jgi:L-ascorbate metabolism protein UlaG (beta-lactamase superfamily)
MRIKFIHHSSFVIVSDKVIYIDPYKIDSKEIIKADFILVTHDHFDHFSPDDINKIANDNTTVIVPEHFKEISHLKGKVQRITTHESLQFEKIRISTIPAYNYDKPFHKQGFGVGYVIDIVEHNKEYCIYHAGDTDFTKEMKTLSGIDYALIPIGGTYTMNSKEAAEFILDVKPKNVIPMHYGETVGISLENNFIPLEDACRKINSKLTILKPKEYIDFYSK